MTQAVSVNPSTVLTLTLIALLASATALGDPVDWTTTGYDQGNVKHVKAPDLSREDVVNLVQESFMPLPPGRSGIHGVTHTPLTRLGVGYVVTNGFVVIAFDLRGGKLLWTLEIPRPGSTSTQVLRDQLGHVTNVKIVNIAGAEALAIGTPWQSVVLLDIYTGRLLATVDLLGGNERIEGNAGTYGGYPVNFAYDSKRSVLVVGSTSPDAPDAGRAFLMGFRLTQRGPERLWRTFLMPPQVSYDPSWSVEFVQSLRNAWIFDGSKAVDLKSLDRDSVQKLLYGDWSPADGERLRAGGMASWIGGWAVDEATGTVYLTVSQPLPSLDGRLRRGPNFPSSSVIAIESETGKVIWTFQAIPHDVYGYGCNTDVLLVGDMVVTACGNGYLYALDKGTGRLRWFLRPPSNRSDYKPPDPFNEGEMSRAFPSSSGVVILSPPPLSVFGLAADPDRGLIFYSLPLESKEVSSASRPELYLPDQADAILMAIDASTGQIRWSRTLKGEGIAFLTSVNDFLLALTYTGNLYVLESATGEPLLSRSNIGPAMAAPSLGTDVEGNLRIVLSMSSVNNPGYLLTLRPLRTLAQETVRTVVTITVQTTVSPESGAPQPSSQSVLLLIVSVLIMALALAVLVRERVLRRSRT
ncbi:MAG: PQQ-binding-like beta-propeller repeat protein [Aigarchaeota archaeon]|nr:PQQ-binding-like beta-propeller repeat protein [Candidatus Calditenuis fumarioli]